MLSAAQIKTLSQLRQKKYRQHQGKFLIEGFNLCESALSHNAPVEIILVTENLLAKEEFAKIQLLAEKRNTRLEFISRREIKRLSDARTPPGIIALVRKETLDWRSIVDTVPSFSLLLDRVSDPGNLGTLIRAADWFGFGAVLCSPHCVDIYNQKALRATAGSFFSIPFLAEGVPLVEAIQMLLERDATIWVADPDAGTAIWELQPESPFALVLGHERAGISASLYDLPVQPVRVPGYGGADSLNVAMAGVAVMTEAAHWRFIKKDQRHGRSI